MAGFLNACCFTPSAGGTTDWTVSAAVTGYMTPAAAGAANGRLYKYRAESADLSQWEMGEGAYNSGTGVLARTTVLFNSAGNTSKINFSAVPQVAIVALAEDLVPQTVGHIPGEPSNTAAASGEIGEYIEYTFGIVSLVNGGAAINIGSGAFPAGDWDIRGVIFITAAGATVATNWNFSISATSANHDVSSPDRHSQMRNGTGWGDPIWNAYIGPHMRRFTTSTTLFLTASGSFSSLLSVSGKISGRRVR